MHDPLACVNVNGDELVDQELALGSGVYTLTLMFFGNLVHERPALRYGCEGLHLRVWVVSST